MTSLADIIKAANAPGGVAPPAADPLAAMAPMFAMMQQQMAASEARAREEREERNRQEEARRTEKQQFMQALIALGTVVLPKLLEPKGPDPMVLKLLDSSTNRDSMKEMLASSMALQQQQTQAMLQNFLTMTSGMGEMQSRLQEKAMDQMEQRLERMAEKEDDDGESSSPILDIIKLALPAILPAKTAAVAGAVAGAVATAAAKPPAAPPVAGAPQPAPRLVAPERSPELVRKVTLMQIAMALHLRGAGMDEAKRVAFQTKLVHLVARSNDVADAIHSDDQGALFAALTPAIEAEPPLAKWVATTEAQGFLAELIANLIKPGLIAVAAELQRRQASTDQPTPAAPPTEPATIGPANPNG